jgi:hypothetical protein
MKNSRTTSRGPVADRGPAVDKHWSKAHKCEAQYLLSFIVFGGIRRRDRYQPIFLVSIGIEISVSEELAAAVPRYKARPYVVC